MAPIERVHLLRHANEVDKPLGIRKKTSGNQSSSLIIILGEIKDGTPYPVSTFQDNRHYR